MDYSKYPWLVSSYHDFHILLSYIATASYTLKTPIPSKNQPNTLSSLPYR